MNYFYGHVRYSGEPPGTKLPLDAQGANKYDFVQVVDLTGGYVKLQWKFKTPMNQSYCVVGQESSSTFPTVSYPLNQGLELFPWGYEFLFAYSGGWNSFSLVVCGG